MVNAGTFVDDRFMEHNFPENSRVAVRAGIGALSLYHFGMRDQVTTIWGLWSIRGSNLDVDDPEKGSRYPESDPTPEEVNWLQEKVNLSPGCYTNPRGCFRWDNSSIVEDNLDAFDYILFIDNGGDSNMRTVTNETGKPVVFIDTFYDANTECRYENMEYKNKTFCYGRSMIDITQRIEELAIALGVDVDTEKVNKEKEESCAAAQLFTETMKQKQAEGLRFMTSINAIKKDENGTDYFEFRTLDPIDLWIPRTLEELGMPLMHSDEGSLTLEDISTRVTTDEFFIGCPDGAAKRDCNDETMYPVDFWLWDSRSYLNVLGVPIEVFETVFPDKATLAGQHWHYGRNDGPLSYNGITKILNEMTERVKDAQRLYPETECSPVDPKTEHTKQIGGGLDRGEFICYNEELIQLEYLSTCAEESASDSAESQSGSSSADGESVSDSAEGESVSDSADGEPVSDSADSESVSSSTDGESVSGLSTKDESLSTSIFGGWTKFFTVIMLMLTSTNLI